MLLSACALKFQVNRWREKCSWISGGLSAPHRVHKQPFPLSTWTSNFNSFQLAHPNSLASGFSGCPCKLSGGHMYCRIRILFSLPYVYLCLCPLSSLPCWMCIKYYTIFLATSQLTFIHNKPDSLWNWYSKWQKATSLDDFLFKDKWQN